MDKKFRDYFREKHGFWPAMNGEDVYRTFTRMMDTMADYVDEEVEKLRKEKKG